MSTTNYGRVSSGFNYQVRYTWECGPGVVHPKFTYEATSSEERSIDRATAALDRMDRSPDLRLVEVHWRHISSNEWTKVE